MLRDMCRNFADNELAPHAGEWDKNHSFPSEQVTKLYCIPEEVTKKEQKVTIPIFIYGAIRAISSVWHFPAAGKTKFSQSIS